MKKDCPFEVRYDLNILKNTRAYSCHLDQNGADNIYRMVCNEDTWNSFMGFMSQQRDYT